MLTSHMFYWYLYKLAGYETARSLAFHGAHVVMACRNLETAEVARGRIQGERSQVKVEVMKLDLASLQSVKEFADLYKQKEWYI